MITRREARVLNHTISRSSFLWRCVQRWFQSLFPPPVALLFFLPHALAQDLFHVIAQRTYMPSCLHPLVLSPWTWGGWPCKLGLTETGRSQSVHAVCFWFAILNCPDCCNGALHLWGFPLWGELACAIYENHPDSYTGFEIRRSFVSSESQKKSRRHCRHSWY